MSQPNDLSRSLTSLEQDSTIIAVIEMSQSSWLVAGIVPGIERHPLKKIEPSQEELICLLMRWRAEATKHGRTIMRIAVAFEAGRDGFWLARWLQARDIEIYVIHPTSVAVSREHRRAKTDRLDTGLLKRVFIGWLRGEPDHCHMAAIPTLAEEDAKRPNRQRERLVRERTRIVNRMKSCLVRFGVRNFKPTLRKAPEQLETLHAPEGVAKRAQETGGVLCHESGPATLLVRGKPRSMPLASDHRPAFHLRWPRPSLRPTCSELAPVAFSSGPDLRQRAGPPSQQSTRLGATLPDEVQARIATPPLNRG